MNNGLKGTRQEGGRPETDAAAYELAGQYLAGLLPDLNLRLLCDAETESGFYPQRILWVEKITMLKAEDRTPDLGREKYCREEGPLSKGKESALSGQIKYMLEKIKDCFKTLWKKKGR